MTTLIPKFDFKNGGATPAGAINRPINEKLSDFVSVKDFGAVEYSVSTSDQAASIQAAIDYGIANKLPVEINGNYSCSEITIVNDSGYPFRITGLGTLIGMPTGAYDALITIANCSQVVIDGKITISGSNNTGYEAGILCYSDTVTGSSKHTFVNVTFTSIKRAWQFGRATEVDALISEITVFGGSMYQVPQAIVAYGTQTVVNFVGSQLITGTNSAFTGVDRRGLISYGAGVTIQGGEFLMADVTNGYLVEMQPIADVPRGNPYGQVSLNGVFVESASQYCHIKNPSALSVTATKVFSQFQMIDCRGYHSQNASALIVVEATDYPGSVVVQNCNFYCNIVRSQPNVQSLSDLCNIYVDEHSFGQNFVQGLLGITGGIPHYSWRTIFIASNCNSQSIPATTNTTLKFTSVAATGELQHFSSDYSTSTGIFTIPTGGLAEIEVTGSLRTNAPTAVLNLFLSLNGSIIDYLPLMVGGAGNSGVISGTFSAYNLSAGDEIALVAYSGSAATTNFGASEQFIIKARN